MSPASSGARTIRSTRLATPETEFFGRYPGLPEVLHQHQVVARLVQLSNENRIAVAQDHEAVVFVLFSSMMLSARSAVEYASGHFLPGNSSGGSTAPPCVRCPNDANRAPTQELSGDNEVLSSPARRGKLSDIGLKPAPLVGSSGGTGQSLRHGAGGDQAGLVNAGTDRGSIDTSHGPSP